MLLELPLIYTLVVVGAVSVCLIILYSMRRRGGGGGEISKIENLEVNSTNMPFKVAKTVPRKKVGRVQKELRLLGLEREILGDAIRRLYEAHAEGKITEEEREKIARTYKARIRRVKEEISKDESLIALHELESMQEDLLKLFSDRFDELTGKIERLRSELEVKPVKEVPVPPAQKTPKKPKKKKTTKKKTAKKKKDKKKKKKKKKEKKESKTKPKTEAEKKVEQIREEVEKVLDRLGQMEVET